MEELDWETNMLFPWSNINYPQQQIEENIIFGSENIFSNPIRHPPKPGSTICSSFDSEGKNVIPITTPATVTYLDCLLSATNSDAYTTSPDHGEGISVIFSDCKNLCNEYIKNLDDVVSSGGSVTKETDDGVDSHCSSEKKSTSDSGFDEHNRRRSKRRRSDPVQSTSSAINFQQATESNDEVIAQMKEMIYRAAAFRPVSFADDDVVEKPRRKNVRISSDPQTVAARKRRERISERIRVLQNLVPGGNKMDTASMLDEAANYLKFLRSQVKALEQFGDYVRCGTTTNAHSTTQNVIHNVTLGVPFLLQNPFLLPHQQIYPTLPPA